MTENSSRRREKPQERRDASAQTIDRWTKIRIYAASAIIVALFGVIGMKAYAIQVTEGARFSALSERQHLRSLKIPGPRGVLLDAVGRELAVTVDVDSVFASPGRIVDVDATASALGKALGVNTGSLRTKLSSSRHFVWVQRRISEAQARAVRALDLPGIELTPEPKRYYPSGDLAGPVLGFAGIDGKGLDGVEMTMNELMVGKQAIVAALRDASGRALLAAGVTEPTPGATVTLTLDRAVQFIADRALQEAAKEFGAKGGTLVVLDVATSEVLAMANWPNYDPNNPITAVESKSRNRAVTDTFEIGSVMKVFTMGGALEAGVVNPETMIDTEHGRYKVGRKMIRDDHRDWDLSIGDCLKRSSNVCAVKVARKLGRPGLHRTLKNFGFGNRTSIELPGESAGLVRRPEKWGEIGFATIAYGYGVTVSAIQVAAAYAAIGNGGTYFEPRIVKRVDSLGADPELLYKHEPSGRRVMSARTTAQLRKMLASVFKKGNKHTRGTAHALHVAGYRAGGKTGTSHKVDPKTRRYSNELYVGAFAGLAPIDDPRIAVVVIIDEPRPDRHYGAQVAGPTFARVVSETLRYLGVPTTESDEPEPKKGKRVKKRPRAELVHVEPEVTEDLGERQEVRAEDLALDDQEFDDNAVVIPDFTGLGMGRVLDISRAVGLSVDVVGTGRVTSQEPGPGLAVPRSIRGSAGARFDCRIRFEPAR